MASQGKSCSSSDSSNGMPEDWEDWENDEWETDRVQCLFSDDTFDTVDAAIAFDKEKNGFSFEEYREKVRVACSLNFAVVAVRFIAIFDTCIGD
jgi:predicted nucleic acid-binding protein